MERTEVTVNFSNRDKTYNVSVPTAHRNECVAGWIEAQKKQKGWPENEPTEIAVEKT